MINDKKDIVNMSESNMENLSISVSKNKVKKFTTAINLINDIRKSLNIKIVLIGAVALATYLPKSRNTEDIDFITEVSNKSRILKYLLQNDIKFSVEDSYHIKIYGDKNKSEIDILLVFTEALLSVLDNTRRIRLFGVETQATSAEGLVLMYLFSDKMQNKVDAKNLINSQEFNSAKFLRILSELDPLDREELTNEFNKVAKVNEAKFSQSELSKRLTRNN